MRLARLRVATPATLLARSLRMLPAYGVGGILNATLVARGARWCVPRVARRRVDKLAAERMAAFEGEAKKTR